MLAPKQTAATLRKCILIAMHERKVVRSGRAVSRREDAARQVAGGGRLDRLIGRRVCAHYHHKERVLPDGPLLAPDLI